MRIKNKIVIFACNWCSPISVDFESLNGDAASTYIIRLMCAGRFQPSFALKAFELGADGVLIIGCQNGECHYVSGNKKAKEQFEITQTLLHLLGIGAQKIRFEQATKDEWIGADEGERFAQLINEFSLELEKLGPSPLSPK